MRCTVKHGETAGGTEFRPGELDQSRSYEKRAKKK
jgi:hypothetical protein